MTVLLCSNRNGINDYIRLLSEEYEKNDVNVIFGIETFLYSKFLPDFVHMQWPEAIYEWTNKMEKNNDTLILLEKRLKYYKLNKVPIIYTMHNVLPHNSKTDFDKKAFKLIISYSNIIAHHGKKSIQIFKDTYTEFSDKIHIITPHGPYKKEELNIPASRDNYKIPKDKYVFLNFGSMRANKGSKFLKNVFLKWNNKDTYLLNAGAYITPVSKNNFERIKNLFIKFLVTFIFDKMYISKKQKNLYKEISNKELSKIISVTDVFFLGHLDGLNSGVIALALSYGKPVVFPDIGNFKEQAKGWDWYECYKVGDEQSAIDALNRMYSKMEQKKINSLIFDNTKWLEKNSWTIHVKEIKKSILEIKSTNE